MRHDALNKSIKIPDLPRSPYVWNTPNADKLYNDHLVDPLADEMLREDWLGDEIDSNPLASGEKDEEESRYGAKLGSLAVGLKDGEASEDADDKTKDKDDDEDE